MDILFSNGSASAAGTIRHYLIPQVIKVRAPLSVMEKKGHIRHELKGLRYVWKSRAPRENARRNALRHLVKTFFDGSVEQTVAALLDDASLKLRSQDLDRLREIVDRAEGDGL